MKITTLGDNLKALFAPDDILSLAREVGFIKRLRSLSPVFLVGAIIQTLSTQLEANLADIHRTLGKLSGTMDNYKPFHKQLKKPALTEMMRRLVNQMTERWLLKPFQEALPEQYPFKRIYLHDGSSLKVHPALREIFPGRFSKVTPAAIEMHVTMDLLAGTANYLGIDADKESEHLYRPIPHELLETLLLMDAGYFDIDYCHQIGVEGGFYVIRAKTNINPDTDEAYDEDGLPVRGLVGKKLKSLKIQPGELRDLTVTWKNRPGSYRVIAFWDKRKRCKGYLITNLSRDEFSAARICEMYGLRWQIELFFKELKSFCNLTTFSTRNKHIVQTLVWSSMLALLLKRYVAFGAGLLHQVLISTHKVARCSCNWLSQLITTLLKQEDTEQIMQETTEFLANHAKRANLKRDKKTLLLSMGFGIYPIVD